MRFLKSDHFFDALFMNIVLFFLRKKIPNFFFEKVINEKIIILNFIKKNSKKLKFKMLASFYLNKNTPSSFKFSTGENEPSNEGDRCSCNQIKPQITQKRKVKLSIQNSFVKNF